MPLLWFSETLKWLWHFHFSTFLYMSDAWYFILSVFKSLSLLVFHQVISLTLSSDNSPYIHVLLKQKAPLFIFTFFHGVIKPTPKYSDLLMNLGNIFTFTMNNSLLCWDNIVFTVKSTAGIHRISPLWDPVYLHDVLLEIFMKKKIVSLPWTDQDVILYGPEVCAHTSRGKAGSICNLSL